MKSQAEFWRQVAQRDKRSSPNQKDSVQAELECEAILNLLNHVKFNCLLEVGCANGYLLKQIRQKYPLPHLVGVDFTQQFIKQATRENCDVEFRVGNVLNLRFPSETFDVVVSRRCLINLPDDKAQQLAVQEIHRVLKAQGAFIMLESSQQGYNQLNKARKKVGLKPIQVARHNHALNVDSLNLSGFTVQHHDDFSAYYYLTRVFYPLMISPREPEYNTRFHLEAAKVQRQLGGLTPNVDPIILWTLKKEK